MGKWSFMIESKKGDLESDPSDDFIEDALSLAKDFLTSQKKFSKLSLESYNPWSNDESFQWCCTFTFDNPYITFITLTSAPRAHRETTHVELPHAHLDFLSLSFVPRIVKRFLLSLWARPSIVHLLGTPLSLLLACQANGMPKFNGDFFLRKKKERKNTPLLTPMGSHFQLKGSHLRFLIGPIFHWVVVSPPLKSAKRSLA